VTKSNIEKGKKGGKDQAKFLGPAGVIWDQISEVWPQKANLEIMDVGTIFSRGWATWRFFQN